MKKMLLTLLLLLCISSVALAFHMPDCKKGLALKSIGRYSITPTLQMEITEIDFSEYDFKIGLGIKEIDLSGLCDWLDVWSLDAGIGNDLIMLSLNKTLVPIVELQVGFFVGYDFDRFDGGFETGFVLHAILW